MTGNGKNPQKKPARLPTHLTPGNPGNRGGKKGRSGRKPDEFKAMCEAACDDVVLPKVLAYLNRKGADPEDPWWWKCADYVTNYGKGKPAQPVTGEEGNGPVVVRVIREAPNVVTDY